MKHARQYLVIEEDVIKLFGLEMWKISPRTCLVILCMINIL